MSINKIGGECDRCYYLIMFVDNLLRLLGDNPNQYGQNIDKWISVFGNILYLILNILPYLLFSLPWIWILARRKRGLLITKKSILLVLVLSLVLLIIGVYTPELVQYLIAIIGIRSYYGM